MYRIFFSLLCLSVFGVLDAYSQLDCGFEVLLPKPGNVLLHSSNIPNPGQYAPTDATPIKYIRVNFHFMLMANRAGNFRPDGAGTIDGSVYRNNAYHFASNVIRTANEVLGKNPKIWQPYNNNIPNIARKYRYVLTGVFFHTNDTYYCYKDNPPPVAYWSNKGEEINYFFAGVDSIGQKGQGMATYGGDRWGKQRYAWERYQPGGDNAGDMVPVWNVSAQTLNHEIGHNMGLLHTELNYCSGNWDFDYCDDTPSKQEYLDVLSCWC